MASLDAETCREITVIEKVHYLVNLLIFLHSVLHTYNRPSILFTWILWQTLFATSSLGLFTYARRTRMGVKMSGRDADNLSWTSVQVKNVWSYTSVPPYVLMTWLLRAGKILLPIPVAARSKPWVCGHWLVGIAGSNPSGDMDVCLLWVLCVEVSATGRSLVQRTPTECVSLSVIKCNNNTLHLQWAGRKRSITRQFYLYLYQTLFSGLKKFRTNMAKRPSRAQPGAF
jgi:hypothetical protein